MLPTTKLQKENNPSKDEYKNPQLLKSVKVSVVNDLKDETAINQRLSIQVDVSSNNKRVTKIPNSPTKERVVDVVRDTNNKNENLAEETNPMVEKGGGIRRSSKDIDDYKSPLDALHTRT